MNDGVESRSTDTPPNGALMLGPTLQQVRPAPLAGLPFLGLGGRQGQAQDAVPGRHNLPTPWPAPRWLSGPERDVAPPESRADEMARRNDPTGSQYPSTSEPDGQDLQTLVGLAPALTWAARRGAGPSAPVRSSPRRADPALVGILSPSRAGPTATRATRSDFAPRPGLSWPAAAEFPGGAGMSSAAPAGRRSPDLPARAVQRAGEAAGPVATGRPVAAAANHRPGRPSNATGDGERVPSGGATLPQRAATPPWSLLNALPGGAFRAAPPSPADAAAPSLTMREADVSGPRAGEPVGRRPPEQEPGPYAPTPLQGLTVVTGAVEQLVERRVTSEVKRQREEIEIETRRRERAEDAGPTLDVTSDEIVRVLLKKMQALGREERFRLGRLR